MSNASANSKQSSWSVRYLSCRSFLQVISIRPHSSHAPLSILFRVLLDRETTLLVSLLQRFQCVVAGLRPTPAAWEQLEHNTALLAATPAAADSLRAVSPGNAVNSRSSLDQTRLSAAALLASPIRSPGNAIASAAAAAAASAAQHELVAATPAALQALAPTSKQASPLEAVAGHSPQAVQRQQQAEEPDLFLASTPRLSSSLLAETPLQAVLPDPAAAHAPEDASRPAALQSGTPPSASLQRVSLGPQNTASQGASGAEHSSLRRLLSISSSLADLNLSAFTPAQQAEPAAAAASTVGANAAGPAAETHTTCRSNSDDPPLLLMASPSPSQKDKPAAIQGGRVDSSDTGESCLGANTTAASQHAELKQLVQEMQHMWVAATPDPIQASCKAEASTRQQQRQLAAKADTATQQRKRGTQAAAHNAAAEEELQQQQQEQQQMLAEQHYQAWLQKQAEAAAATELQHLELAATAAGQLTPLQQMLQGCSQSVSMRHMIMHRCCSCSCWHGLQDVDPFWSGCCLQPHWELAPPCLAWVIAQQACTSSAVQCGVC